MRRAGTVKSRSLGLRQGEAGVKTADVCREHGISEATFYGWQQKCGGMEVAEAQAAEAAEGREPPVVQPLRIVADTATDVDPLDLPPISQPFITGDSQVG